MLKEDFSSFSPNWCNKVCRVTDKEIPTNLVLSDQPHVDVLIISDYTPLPDKRYKKPQSDMKRKEERIISHLCSVSLSPTLSRTTITLLKCQSKTEQSQVNMLDCSPYLHTQIHAINPKVIVSLSTTVTKALGIKASNTSDCGKIFTYQDIPVVLTIHPRILSMVRQNQSGALWGADYFHIIAEDFKKAGLIAKGELAPKDVKKAVEETKQHIRVVATLEEVTELKNLLFSNPSVKSFDIETTGLDPYAKDAAILCCQFGFKDADGSYVSFVVPLFHPRVPPPYDPEEAWKILAPVLESEDVVKVGHNIKFDVKYVAVVKGLRIRGVKFDTMLLLHALNSGLQGLYSLKTAVGYYLPETGLMGYEDLLNEK